MGCASDHRTDGRGLVRGPRAQRADARQEVADAIGCSRSSPGMAHQPGASCRLFRETDPNHFGLAILFLRTTKVSGQCGTAKPLTLPPERGVDAELRGEDPLGEIRAGRTAPSAPLKTNGALGKRGCPLRRCPSSANSQRHRPRERPPGADLFGFRP